MSEAIRERFARVGALIREHRDIIERRVTEPAIPAWCSTRGWDGFLVALPDDALACCEAAGLLQVAIRQGGAPPALVSMVQEITNLTSIPMLEGRTILPGHDLKSVKARKREQLSSLLAVAAELASHASRIVDVGAGQGHLTRAAARAWDKSALGLERETSLVEAARVLASDRRVEFRRWNAFEEDLPLRSSDLVMGLHACGEVGDVLVRRAAEASARVLLVSCCPQKVRAAERAPLSEMGMAMGLSFRREVLGLANLSQLARGVEASLSETMQSRETRHALRNLLRERGVEVEAGQEMQKLNRRRAYQGLPAIAERALSLRGLKPPTAAEIADHGRRAHAEYGFMRRLSLPRTVLARLIEVAVVLDRAMCLIERGHAVRVATVFAPEVSPRNLALLGEGERKPTSLAT